MAGITSESFDFGGGFRAGAAKNNNHIFNSFGKNYLDEPFVAMFEGVYGGAVSEFLSKRPENLLVDNTNIAFMEAEECIKKDKLPGGSMATLVCAGDDRVTSVYCGTSLPLVVKEDGGHFVFPSHNSQNITEVLRMAAKGYNVGADGNFRFGQYWIKTSRLIGMTELKRVGGLTCIPQVENFYTDNNETLFALIGSSGFWNVLNFKQVISFVQYEISINKNVEDISRNLLTFAAFKALPINVCNLSVSIMLYPKSRFHFDTVKVNIHQRIDGMREYFENDTEFVDALRKCIDYHASASIV